MPNLLALLNYSSDELQSFDVKMTLPHRDVRRCLFECRIGIRRSKYTPAASGDCVVPRTVQQNEAVEKKSARIKSRPVVELGGLNCRLVDNKLDYICDHCKDNNFRVDGNSDIK